MMALGLQYPMAQITFNDAADHKPATHLFATSPLLLLAGQVEAPSMHLAGRHFTRT